MLSDDQIQAVWEGLQWKDLDPLHPDFNKRLNLRFGHAVEDAALRAQADAGPVGDESQMPRVHGVSRIADNPCSVLVMLMAEPSDDALREIHDRLRAQSGQRAGVAEGWQLSLIHISEPTRQAEISYAVFCLKKKKYLKT